MNEFAKVVWKWQDIQGLREDWTEEQCVDFLKNNQKYIREAMTESGWDAIKTLISEEV